MTIINKMSGETRLESWNFSPSMSHGEALTGNPTFSIVDSSTGLTSTDLTVGTPAKSATQVQAQVSGGVVGVLYFVTCTCATTYGQVLQVRGGIILE